MLRNICLLICLLLSACGPPPERAWQARLAREQQLRAERKLLVRVPLQVAEGDAAVSLHLPVDELAGELLLVDPDASARYVFVGPEGRVEVNGEPAGRAREALELLQTRGGSTLFADKVPVAGIEGQWQVHFARHSPEPPALRLQRWPRVRLTDGFMRSDLLASDWRVHSGDWDLRQRGGGMPQNEQQAKSYHVQRAVNPFSVWGESGLLSYGREAWPHVEAEARFYFGVPREGRVTDLRTLPTDRDMLVALGDPDGYLVAGGWHGEAGAFVLLAREDGAWRELARFARKRPAISNWVRVGLRLERGHRLTLRLDGEAVATADTQRRVEGGLHLLARGGAVELDDVRARSLPLASHPGAPVYVRSRNFAAKKRKSKRADPEQFAQWARGEDLFLPSTRARPDGRTARAITTADPLLGDFAYESQPVAEQAGKLPPGLYEFALLPGFGRDRMSVLALKPALRLLLRRDATGWHAPELAAWPAEHREFALRLRRRDGQLQVRLQDAYVPVGEAVPGPVHLRIAALQPPGEQRAHPHPAHHPVTDRQRVNELFEAAPTAWSWIDGSFRMDARWACQDQWNFMACGSVHTPYMTSKRRFHGAQVHDFFMSIRPVTPWDAGDRGFSYDPRADRRKGFRILRRHNGWYNRRDLNFSFCSDGRNPLSGYAVIFAGYNNEQTLLMRRGEVVARSDATMPEGTRHTQVHWRWWRFRVSLHEGRVRVDVNGRELFDYDDPEPLSGGHIGFWSIRNGFVVSKVASVAERLDRAPRVLYVRDSDPSPWQPLVRDSMELEVLDDGRTRARFVTGAGSQGLRWTPEAPVDLAETPVLHLPFELDADARLALHLEIGDRSYLLPFPEAPLTHTHRLLTRPHERGEPFQKELIPVRRLQKRHKLGDVTAREGTLSLDLRELVRGLDESASLALRRLTVGNTSNAGYLLAGGGGNRAGTEVVLGSPRFRSEAAAQEDP